MTGSAWVDISDEAKDFVKKLLNRCVFLHILMLMYTVTRRNIGTSNGCRNIVHRRLVYDIKACRVCTNWDCDAAQEVTSGRWVVYLIKAWFIWCTRLPSMSHRIAQNAMGLLWHPGTRSSGRRRGRP